MKWKVAAGATAALLLAIQLIPYGKDHTNPPVVAEPAWSGESRDIARRACFDCHSHETVWPWYSNVAPMSWLVQYDVTEGREELNFSDWRRGGRKHENLRDIRKEMEEGEMPPAAYRLAHAEARLSAAEREKLVAGLASSTPADRPNRKR